MRYTAQGAFETFDSKIIPGRNDKPDFEIGTIVINVVNKRLNYDTEEFELMPPVPVPFTVRGKLVEKIKVIAFGAKCDVSFEVSGREYQGKYYAELRAFKIVVDGDQPSPAPEGEKLPEADIPF